jgi:hypothetical protein
MASLKGGPIEYFAIGPGEAVGIIREPRLQHVDRPPETGTLTGARPVVPGRLIAFSADSSDPSSSITRSSKMTGPFRATSLSDFAGSSETCLRVSC